MKKILIISFILFTSLIADAQITKAELTATGLTCSMCSKATYKQLASIPEIEKVEADLNKTAFILYFKNGSTVNVGDLRKKVEDAGFSVGELIIVFNFDKQKAENNSSFTQNNITYTFMDTKPGVLAGEVKIKILDKGFVIEKEHKKLLKLSKQYPSYATANNNLYHIKTL
ncbi:MAG: heavy-metal-associated domain-containing protein [Ferruginibacter sp.]|nr:heavy-metal-associated domain-containing protein [Chitinophagaceae bacterium]